MSKSDGSPTPRRADYTESARKYPRDPSRDGSPPHTPEQVHEAGGRGPRYGEVHNSGLRSS